MTTIVPKKRINSIDALRGFALIGIMLWHCMERFDLTIIPTVDSPFWQSVDTCVFNTANFLFAGKSYAIFSFLFGLSFYIQMDSQATKGNDFRLRFMWRLVLLFIFGYINTLVYLGEFFIIYAVLGMFLVPIYKVPSKWLAVIMVLLFLQIPAIISFISLLGNNVENEPTGLSIYLNHLYETCAVIFSEGSVSDVLYFNMREGQLVKWIWMINNFRYLQLLGLFIAGMLVGRMGIHKSEEQMVIYSRKALPYSVACFAVFYVIALLLPTMGVDGYALKVGQTMFKTFANLGMMMIYICGFTLLYYCHGWQKLLDYIAPVGRMSVTNYMFQSLVGVTLFYGFGANLAVNCNYLQSMLVGLAVIAVQITYSNWWIKRFYYGPMEWLWRTLTWMADVPLLRRKAD